MEKPSVIAKLRATFAEYPAQFWLLMSANFIDLLGGFLIFPFFSLYFTEKFGVGLAEAGLVYGIWAIAGIGGSAMGGALADRIGRKRMLIVGLVLSALTSLALALAPDFLWVYITAALGGLFATSGGPAQQAMVADVLPAEQYSDGFGMHRVVANVAFAIGPAIGGLLASVSFTLLFVIDAITSILAALFVARYLRESQSAESAGRVSGQNIAAVLGGYASVLKDLKLVVIIVLSGLVGLVYFQWYFSVPVFMRDTHSLPPNYYGSLMAFAGVLVVFFQLSITRKARPYAPMVVMAFGSLLFAIGFGMFAFISALGFFVIAFAIITAGEMVFFPTQHAIVAQLAPEDMRGRYMATAGLAFSLPNIVGPALGGLLLDRADPNLLWVLASSLCLAGLLGFAALRRPFSLKAAEAAGA
jgi:MFS family permease